MCGFIDGVGPGVRRLPCQPALKLIQALLYGAPELTFLSLTVFSVHIQGCIWENIGRCSGDLYRVGPSEDQRFVDPVGAREARPRVHCIGDEAAGAGAGRGHAGASSGSLRATRRLDVQV